MIVIIVVIPCSSSLSLYVQLFRVGLGIKHAFSFMNYTPAKQYLWWHTKSNASRQTLFPYMSYILCLKLPVPDTSSDHANGENSHITATQDLCGLTCGAHNSLNPIHQCHVVQTAKTFGSTSIRRWSDTNVSGRCVIDGDPIVLVLSGW